MVIELPNSLIKLRNILIKPYFDNNIFINNYKLLLNSHNFKI